LSHSLHSLAMDEQRLKEVFGQELRKARNVAGISQEKLALLVGLDRTYISMLERGLRQPTLTTIFLLCPPLNLSSVEMVMKVQSSFDEGS
jgi:transcriptional regulator with XRE-family HTH domain